MSNPMSDMQSHLYESIGRLIVSFQGLEQSVEQVIFGSMTSTHTQVRIMMSEMSFKTKVHTMASLIRDLHPKDESLYSGKTVYECLDNIIKGCHQSEGKRNQIVHSNWFTGFKDSPDLHLRTKESAKSKKGYVYSVEHIEYGFLDEEIAFIDNLFGEIHDFAQKLSIQFDRPHGILGLSGLVSHGDLTKAINDKLMAKNQNHENEKS